MAVLTWIAVVFFLVATIGTALHAARRGWRTFKTFGAVAGSLADAIAAVAASADEAARRAEALPEAGERLSRELSALAVSRAQLGVLLGALARTRETVDGFRGLVLGKG
jgi:hypothetical protein